MPKTRGESIFLQPGDRPIFIIFAIQTFTVIWQVAFASVLGVYHGYGFTVNFIPNYLTTYCKNFIMALPLQLIIVGPLARLIFRSLFMPQVSADHSNKRMSHRHRSGK